MANTMVEDPRLSQCGIAKLLGARGDEVLEYFMRKYAIVLGRNSKNCQVDLVLGDSMSISRKHASIVYNFEARCFELHVMGKNGVHKDGELITPEKAPVTLHSGNRIRTGDCDFYFLLPSGGPIAAAAAAPEPPRNGITAAAQEPAHQQALASAANSDVHAAGIRAEVSAAELQSPGSAVHGAVDVHAYAPAQDGASPMQVDSTAAPQPLQPRTTAAAQPNIMGQVVTPAADQAAVMDVVAAYCAVQGSSGVGEGHQMFSKLAEALSAMPPQQLQDRLPPQ